MEDLTHYKGIASSSTWMVGFDLMTHGILWRKQKQWVSNQHPNHFESTYDLDDDNVKSEIDNFVQIDQQLERTIVVDAFHILHELGALWDCLQMVVLVI